PEFEGYGPKTNKSVSEDISNEVTKSPDAPLVKELVSDDKLEKKTVFPIVAKIEFVRPKQQEKPVRKPVKNAEMYRSQSPRGNQRNWNNQKSQQLGSDFVMYNKACFVCGSFDHVQADYNYHQRERVVSGNNYTRVNYNYSAKKAHPSAHRNIVPRAVLMKTGIRPLNTAHPKTIVYSARPMLHFSKSVQSTIKRPYQIRTTFTNKNFSQKVNTATEKFYTARPKAVNTAKPNLAVVNAMRANQVNVVKASTCWVWRPTNLNSASITLKRRNYVDARGSSKKEDQGYVDSGCSRHMTGNMSYLSNFKEFNGGYVTFVEEPNERKLLMCDKKNNVLFTDTGCFVLSPDFKLADESQVLLKVPRKNNMYNVDMKNIISKESLSCLVAKATLDESMLWHRRLSHVNFKTISKLVKENTVRGLPTKHFENDQTCVACLKGKQHKASCKSKIQNSITQPLFMLHMDLFGPTFVSSLMNKKYCLVVTDDYSRFTWVFFLATKNETSGILKSIITEIENLVDKKAEIIRCDNGTEFKNRVMSDFCEKKGIKKEFSVARTPQQNSVVERRNRTLIEAARTRVLVVKPHNKTPYELFRGRTPALSFMRPFGCHVTILNTLDYLGKFDGKSDEGFFVGYSLNSKAFRVYNIRTRKVEEILHIRFLEDKPIIAGDGPKWMFDIDVLTKSMNYMPVVAGTNSNDFIGTEESIGASHSSKETGSSQDYILMPLWKDGSLFNSSSKNASNDEPQPSSDAEKNDHDGVSKESETDNHEMPKNNPQEVNTAEPKVDTSNITTTYPVPSTPNTRIHKDHSLDHVIGDVQSEPKRITKALSDPAWVEAMQEELPRNKKDERSIVIRNKARLVTHGHSQEEGIDYDEVFAPIARIKPIRLFLAYASFMGFMMYQMDVKSAFLYGQIEEEVYVCQPPGFEDPDYPDTEFEKLMKDKFQMSSMGELTFFLGLQVKQKEDGIFISQDKYVAEVLRKFNFSDVKSASTPMDTEKALLKDSNGDDVDVHLYRLMIGSLMYLTSFRPDIMFVVCACARFQVTPKVSHLHAIKRNFSDYAGASLDRKSTTGGCQFLGCRLISW
ncbi:putative ribonuclease H-like domain-containing protein, partial [Tanacetum coccineum]